ncbi:non-specific lipid-transfer protein 1 [Cryptomeria japonica]|uniref:non-specific lipid-transfer protein 1 n=1 Tax=Cryptomeria japonica TaxID=3369 RepID=UPI0025AC4750|nr:non-specific lipid-transfer protein 1 [Cryptomeria japonica]
MAKSVLLVLMVLIAFYSCSCSAISCGSLTLDLLPCLPYLRSGGGDPSSFCCNEIKQLNAAIRGKEARQGACKCILQQGKRYHINWNNAKQLPGLCKVNLPVPVSPNTDCSRVS